MQYLPTSFAQLFFAWKLYHYGLDGNIDLDVLDSEITFQEEGMVFALPRRILESKDDFFNALENNLTIAFGAAAITLNRSRELAGLRLPNPIQTESDQCIALIYQIRNAFAHDIAEPRWKMTNRMHRRVYKFGGMVFDLSKLHGQPFDYAQIGGPSRLQQIKDFADSNLWQPPEEPYGQQTKDACFRAPPSPLPHKLSPHIP